MLTEDGALALFIRPHPREFAIQGKKKKNANARGSARRGAGVELTDALPKRVVCLDVKFPDVDASQRHRKRIFVLI